MPWIENPTSPLVAKLRGLHLFHFEAAPCAQRVRFALGEKGLVRGAEVTWSSDDPRTLVAPAGTWTSRHVSLIKKQHLTDEYAAIHPNLVVPALVHDGRLHVESMDIVRYLDEIIPEPPLMPQATGASDGTDALVERAKKLHVSVRYVSFHWGLGRLGRLSSKEEATLSRLEAKSSPENLLHFYSRFDRDEIDAETYRGHLDALEDAYADLERMLAQDGRPFLTGRALTAADIMWAIKVLRLKECGYPLERNFPALAAWHARIEARPAFQGGVMQKHRGLNRAFRVKSSIENLLGVGLRRVSRSPGDARPAS